MFCKFGMWRLMICARPFLLACGGCQNCRNFGMWRLMICARPFLLACGGCQNCRNFGMWRLTIIYYTPFLLAWGVFGTINGYFLCTTWVCWSVSCLRFFQTSTGWHLLHANRWWFTTNLCVVVRLIQSFQMCLFKWNIWNFCCISESRKKCKLKMVFLTSSIFGIWATVVWHTCANNTPIHVGEQSFLSHQMWKLLINTCKTYFWTLTQKFHQATCCLGGFAWYLAEHRIHVEACHPCWCIRRDVSFSISCNSGTCPLFYHQPFLGWSHGRSYPSFPWLY